MMMMMMIEPSQPYGHIFHKGVQEENYMSRYVFTLAYYNLFGSKTKKVCHKQSSSYKKVKTRIFKQALNKFLLRQPEHFWMMDTL